MSSLRRAFLTSVPLALAWALFEAASQVASGGTWRLFPAAIWLYLVMSAALGLLAAALAAVWQRIRRRADPHLAPSLVFALAALAAFGLWLNTYVLAGFLEPASLLANGALLLLVLPALTWLLRALVALAAPRLTAPWRRIRLPFAALTCAALILPLLFAPASSAVPPPPVGGDSARPNVLFVLVDTLRADHLGSYGYARPTSPQMDALAGAGALFERCIAQSSHTKPSTASILTSLHPPTHRMELMTSTLPPEAVTLHEAFYAAGWRTAAFSGNSFVSRTFGFGDGVERFRGAVVSPSVVLAGYRIMARLRDILVYNLGLSAAPWRAYQILVDSPFDLTEDRRGMGARAINGEFLAWLEELGSDEPWFAYLHYMEPHAPYAPPPECRIFGNAEDPALGRDVPQAPGTCFLPFQPGVAVDDATLAAMVANYDGDVLDADRALGELLETLRARGALEDTIILLTADHGEEFLDHGAWGHGQSLHRELVHVPLMLTWPGQIPPGRRIADQVRSVDIMPTLCELAGAPAPAACQGRSLAPLLRDGAVGAPEREAFSEVYWGGSWARSLRASGELLIEARMGAREAVQRFDLRQDPWERRDLAAADPAAAQTLLARLHAMREELARRSLRPGRATLDAATRENLEDLGYVGD